MNTVQPLPEVAPVICLDIGGTAVRAASVTLGPAPQVEHRLATATLADQGGPAVLQQVVEAAEQVRRRAPEAGGVAVSSAGVIDPESGTVASATDQIHHWAGTRIGATLTQRLRLPATVINDVHAHGLGESRFGAGVNSSSALIAAIGTGLGGALISQGSLVRGATGHAGHIGHMHHGSAAAMICSCGRTGHLESVASGGGMAQHYAMAKRQQDPPAVNGAEVAGLAAEGVAAAQQVLRSGAAALGQTLGSLANAWDPEQIILTGSVTGAGPQWWHHLRLGYQTMAMDGVQDRVLEPGILGDDAPLLGAAVAHYDRGRELKEQTDEGADGDT